MTCIALIPLAPFSLWAYARLASADRGSSVAGNSRVFRSVRHPAGAHLVSSPSYPLYRWDVEGSLVPITAYRTEYFVRLPHAVKTETVYAHYERVLAGWHEQRNSESVQFTRRGVQITVSTAETAHGGRARDYAFYVSQ
jgi:hypothetical protein